MADKQSKKLKPALNTALFNIREITKQMLLLEDHLTGGKEKFCVDCIRKHFLMMEALAEEASTMDSHSEWAPIASNLSRQTRKWQIAFIEGKKPTHISQAIRKRRKDLVEKVFDPRP